MAGESDSSLRQRGPQGSPSASDVDAVGQTGTDVGEARFPHQGTGHSQGSQPSLARPATEGPALEAEAALHNEINSTEVYGFALWMGAAVAYVMYLVWAFTPEMTLQAMGITYYPDRYWALGAPAMFIMVYTLSSLVYLAINLRATPDFSDSATWHDPHSVVLPDRGDWSVIPDASVGTPDISDLPLTMVNKMMFSLAHRRAAQLRAHQPWAAPDPLAPHGSPLASQDAHPGPASGKAGGHFAFGTASTWAVSDGSGTSGASQAHPPRSALSVLHGSAMLPPGPATTPRGPGVALSPVGVDLPGLNPRFAVGALGLGRGGGVGLVPPGVGRSQSVGEVLPPPASALASAPPSMQRSHSTDLPMGQPQVASALARPVIDWNDATSGSDGSGGGGDSALLGSSPGHLHPVGGFHRVGDSASEAGLQGAQASPQPTGASDASGSAAHFPSAEGVPAGSVALPSATGIAATETGSLDDHTRRGISMSPTPGLDVPSLAGGLDVSGLLHGGEGLSMYDSGRGFSSIAWGAEMSTGGGTPGRAPGLSNADEDDFILPSIVRPTPAASGRGVFSELPGPVPVAGLEHTLYGLPSSDAVERDTQSAAPAGMRHSASAPVNLGDLGDISQPELEALLSSKH